MTNKNRYYYLGQLIKLAFREHKILYVLSVISLLSVLLETIAMSFLSSLSGRDFIFFDSYFKGINGNIIFIWVVGLFVIRFISMLYVESRYTYIARKIQVLLSTQTLKKIFTEKLKVIEKKEIGYFISLAGDEASKSSEVINSFLKVVNSALIGALYFLMIVYFDFHIIYILISFFIINILVVRQVLKKIVALGNDSLVLGRSANSIFLDTLNSLRTVKSFGIGKFIYDHYRSNMDDYQHTNYKIFALSLFNKLFPLISLFILFDLYVVYDYFGDKRLSVIYLLTMFFMLMRLFTIIGELLHTGSTMLSNLKLTNNILSFFESTESSRTEELKENIEVIRLQNVSFSHEELNPIFSNVNLSFTKGKSYLVIGKTGTGKSTLLDLIMDFNSPSSGDIFVNDTNTKNIDEKSLTNKILYVSQEAIVFNNTVQYNIEVDKKYTAEKINKFLEVADLSTTIASFNEGLAYVLNYRGTNISGGQKQRLNLVRALVREPDVLILDESVNALDSKTRIKVIGNIIRLYKDKIVIIVSHDKDILDLVDEVVDLDELKRKA